jgi:hypothetical protein
VNGATRVAQIAAHPKWGGGVRVEHLAELMRMEPHDPRLWGFIWQARRLGLVDVWRGWIMADRAVIEKGK